MSKDSSHTYIHLRASHHADLFEEFCHPPSSSSSSTAAPGSTFTNGHATTTAAINTNNNSSNNATSNDQADPSLAHIPGHFLPFESIVLPPHLMPLNPEDEDGVVPDMHAAFGISRAMGAVAGGGEVGAVALGRGEGVWRDFGLDGLVEGTRGLSLNVGATAGSTGVGLVSGVGGQGIRREGARNGILNLR